MKRRRLAAFSASRENEEEKMTEEEIEDLEVSQEDDEQGDEEDENSEEQGGKTSGVGRANGLKGTGRSFAMHWR